LGAWPLAWFAPKMTGCLHRTILQSRWLIGSAHKLVATLGACKITWLNGALDITQDAQ
jgi:hypothetical protein